MSARNYDSLEKFIQANARPKYGSILTELRLATTALVLAPLYALTIIHVIPFNSTFTIAASTNKQRYFMRWYCYYNISICTEYACFEWNYNIIQRVTKYNNYPPTMIFETRRLSQQTCFIILTTAAHHIKCSPHKAMQETHFHAMECPPKPYIWPVLHPIFVPSCFYTASFMTALNIGWKEYNIYLSVSQASNMMTRARSF